MDLVFAPSEIETWPIDRLRQDAVAVHGTQKPVECMRRPILNNSSPGQAVFEPFMGSGTTLIAAETTSRVCFGIELNPAYVDVAIERWQQFTGANAVLADTGETGTAAWPRRTSSFSTSTARPENCTRRSRPSTRARSSAAVGCAGPTAPSTPRPAPATRSRVIASRTACSASCATRAGWALQDRTRRCSRWRWSKRC